MTVKELYDILDERIPSSLSCEWDNDGLMCCPDESREAVRVLIALDVTEDVVGYAISNGFDVIISHHPFIFKGLKAINEDNYIASKAMELIKNGISVMSFHTRLDAVDGGVNDVLAILLGIDNAVAFGEEGIGRLGELEKEVSVDDFAKKVKKLLDAPFVLVGDAHRPVKHVALLGGEGGDDIYSAIAAGADTYVSGRLGYHNMTDASELGINLIEAGHFYTEAPICNAIKDMLSEIDIRIESEIYFSNRIRAV